MIWLQVVSVVAVFIKRQIQRFALKSKSGQHIRIGHDLPRVIVTLFCFFVLIITSWHHLKIIIIYSFLSQEIKVEIRRRLVRTGDISHEPNLLHVEAVKHTTTSDDYGMIKIIIIFWHYWFIQEEDELPTVLNRIISVL